MFRGCELVVIDVALDLAFCQEPIQRRLDWLF
jgi:hypothetical protein